MQFVNFGKLTATSTGRNEISLLNDNETTMTALSGNIRVSRVDFRERHPACVLIAKVEPSKVFRNATRKLLCGRFTIDEHHENDH